MSPPGIMFWRYWRNPLKRVSTVSDTSKRKQTPATIANDKKRVRIKPIIPPPGFGLTPQIVFKASCNWPKTPLAPNKARAIPIVVAIMPAWGFDALAAMSWMTFTPLGSIKYCNCSVIFCWACSLLPKISPKNAKAL